MCLKHAIIITLNVIESFSFSVAGSEDESSSLELKAENQANNAKKVLVNGHAGMGFNAVISCLLNGQLKWTIEGIYVKILFWFFCPGRCVMTCP